MVDKEPLKVGQVKRQENKKRKKGSGKPNQTLNSFKENAFVVEARDINPRNAN